MQAAGRRDGVLRPVFAFWPMADWLVSEGREGKAAASQRISSWQLAAAAASYRLKHLASRR